MLEYPSITANIPYGGPYFIWDKLDGQNLRAEWSRGRGFYKLGARRTHLSDEWREEAAQLIEFQKNSLVEIFRKRRWDRATCFFEFYGDRSFAGVHFPHETHSIALLDVAGPDDLLLDPRDFHKLFYERVQTPALLLRGNFNKETEQLVREGKLPGMTFEGVVGKGPPTVKEGPPTMFKCKSQAWIDKVKSQYGEKAVQYL